MVDVSLNKGNELKRFRATIFVDISAGNIKTAGNRLRAIVKSVPNSFSDGISLVDDSKASL